MIRGRAIDSIPSGSLTTHYSTIDTEWRLVPYNAVIMKYTHQPRRDLITEIEMASIYTHAQRKKERERKKNE